MRVDYKQGKILINPQYPSPNRFLAQFEFSSGLVAVPIEEGENVAWGYIDASGKVAIKPQFSDAYKFNDGLARVRIGDEKTGKWGFISR